jgi:hypothetical protein
MGDFADDAVNQSMDEWLGAMEEEDLENEYWIGYSWRPRSRTKLLKPNGPGTCPSCGSETILREGKFGKFYGCSKFPQCKGSRRF